VPRPAILDRETVLGTALALADADGLDALTMRAIAQRLGVTPMALYRHVGDKQALLDGIVEHLLMEIPLPDPALPWTERLRAMTAAVRASARRHPAVFPLLLQRPAVTAGARRVRDAVYAALRDAGLPEPEIARTERMLASFVFGVAASESGGRFSVDTTVIDSDLEWFGDLLTTALSRHARDGA